MVEQQPQSEPRFIVDVDASPTTRTRARALERRIKEKPTEYLVLMAGLGSKAVEGTNDAGSPVDGDKVAMVSQFFTESADLYVGFDPDTEKSLAEHNQYLVLMADPKKSSNNPEQRQEVRDQLRFFRLEHFIGRVIAWQEVENEDPKAEPSAMLADVPSPSASEDLRTAI